MSTIITDQRSTGWSGATSQSGTLMRTDQRLRWTTTLVPPDLKDLFLTLDIWIDTPSATGSVVIQGRSWTVHPRQWGTIRETLDPTRPVIIDITGVTAADARVRIHTTTTLPVDARPHDVLALEAYCPIPTAALVWDRDRWDRAAWQTTRAVPGTLVWDYGRWDKRYWYDQTLTMAWTPILGPTTRLTTSRGIQGEGPVLTAQAGHLTIEATGLDPRALGISYATPIRLYHWPTQTEIFTGTVSDVRTTPHKNGPATIQITAADAVARLAGTTRYGARPDSGGEETWRQRLARLMASVPQVAYTTRTTSTAPVCPTVWETSLANHIDALVATTGGAWCARRDTGIDVWATLPDTAPALTLTDTHNDDALTPTVLHYSAGPATWSSAALISAIEATTHTAAPDDAGEWRAADRTITVTNPTTTAAWRGATAKVDMLAPATAGAHETAARRLLRRATTTPTLASATIPIVSARTAPATHAARMALAAALDPLTPVIASQAGERARALIARVTHTITPHTWTTTTDLTPNQKDQP